MKTADPEGERPIRVLLVDDEPRVRRALRDLFRMYPDIDVVGEAGSGSEAIALTRDRDPDVVLMDYRMKATNGVEATREIKEQRDPPRVVILTMHPETEAEARQAGADDFLLKGCPQDQLLRAVERSYGPREHQDGRRSHSPLPANQPAGIRRKP